MFQPDSGKFMIDEDLSDPKAPIRGNWNLYDDRNPGIDILDMYVTKSSKRLEKA